MTIQLRDYQERALEWLRARFSQGATSLLLVAPTGAGKGTIAAALLRGVVAHGGRGLFVVHRREIVLDVARRLGIPCAVHVEGKVHGDVNAPVHVVAIQTLIAGGSIPPADVVCWDESQHCTAGTYRALKAKYPDAWHVGLTATPERRDRSPLGDIFEDLYTVATPAELTHRGYLVPCDVIAPAAYRPELAAAPADAWARHTLGASTIVFCATVAHAEEVAASFPPGVAESLDGATSARSRRDMLERFSSGALRVVTNVMVLTEGVDLPIASVAILARGCESAATYLQMVGRILRPYPGKERATLIDLRGVVHVHGLPADDRVYSLHGTPIREAKKLSPLRQCAECGLVFRRVLGQVECARCSTALARLAPPVVKNATLYFAPTIATVPEKRAFFDKLCAKSKEKGWKPLAVGVQFKREYGHWPPWPVPGIAVGGAGGGRGRKAG